jgi:DNA-binding NtrC family response regulator
MFTVQGEIRSMPEPNELRQTVLVIDDDIDVLTLKAEILNRSGYSVIAVNDRRAGVWFFSDPQRRIDLVLLDLDGSRQNDIELAKKMLAIRPATKLIVLSHHLFKIEGGFVLLKPFSLANLLDTVANRLGPCGSTTEGLVASHQ